MEEEKQVIDDQTVNEEQTSEETNTTPEESKQEVSKELQSAIAQKEHFRNKAEKLEEELKNLKPQTNTEEPKEKVKVEPSSSLAEKVAMIEFAQRHRDIDGANIKDILDIAKSKGITPDEALELPMVKNHLEVVANSKAAEAAMPDSTRSSSVQPKKPISEMTREEHKKYFDEKMGN